MIVRSISSMNSVTAILSVLVLAIATAADEQAKPKQLDIATSGKTAGQERDDNCLKMKLVWCPPGSFEMEYIERIQPTLEEVMWNGWTIQSDRTPEGGQIQSVTSVKVLLTKGYWLGKFEVTQGEWKQLMGSEPRHWKYLAEVKLGDEFPATCISWNDAMEFCRKLTEQERQQGRLPTDWEYTLPTEAEWERACRARTETKYNFGDDEADLGQFAWFAENSRAVGEAHAHRVGLKEPNPWGLHDMYGNAWEFCRDEFSERLPGGRDPEILEQESETSQKVTRGGAWHLKRRQFGVLSSPRGFLLTGACDEAIGFRVVLRHAP